jgi:hypothetical protein
MFFLFRVYSDTVRTAVSCPVSFTFHLTILTNFAYFTCKHGERSVDLVRGADRKRKEKRTKCCLLSSLSARSCLICVWVYSYKTPFYFTTMLMCLDCKWTSLLAVHGVSVCVFASSHFSLLLILVGKSEGKLFGRRRCRKEYNIKWISEVMCEDTDWIQLAQIKVHWRAITNEPSGAIRGEEFLGKLSDC